MPAVREPRPAFPLENGPVKMEDRKRPAAHDTSSDAGPPAKKQAVTNGTSNKPHPDQDMPWKDDLEVSQVAAPSS